MPNFAQYSDADLERLINNIYAGSVNASNLPVDLYNTILDRLTDAVFRGFGGTLEDFAQDEARKLLLEYYVHNIAIFSGAKTFQQVKDMSALVFNEKGFKRDFEEFKKIIKGDDFHAGVFKIYNDAWLRTEYDTAFGTAQMGAEWTSIQEDKDVFPYLKYITAKDERVRHSHAEFDGVVRPVDDPFWNTHLPLNGFNCRCRVIQLNEDDDVFTVTPDDKIKKLSPPDSELFSFNAGKNTYIFDESHPYMANVPEKYKVAQSVNFGFPTPKKPTTPLVTPEVKEIGFVNSQTTEETIERLNKLGIEDVNLKGLKLEHQNYVLEAFENEAKKRPLTVKRFEAYRKNNNDGALYSPSNRSIHLNLKNIPKIDGASKVITYEQQIANINTDLELFKKTYLGNVKYNQRQVNNEINKMNRRINDIQRKIKDGETAKIWTVSASKETVKEKVIATITHELGHHRHFEVVGENTYIQYNRKLSFSEYGKSNAKEYFAEWFTYFRMNGEDGIPEIILKELKKI